MNEHGGYSGGGSVRRLDGRSVVSWGKDAAERVVRTFLQAFFGVWTAGGLGVEQLADASVLQKAGAAGIAAAVSLVVSFLAKKFGPSQEDSAGFTT